jgi:hypothetical protein
MIANFSNEELTLLIEVENKIFSGSNKEVTKGFK